MEWDPNPSRRTKHVTINHSNALKHQHFTSHIKYVFLLHLRSIYYKPAFLECFVNLPIKHEHMYYLNWVKQTITAVLHVNFKVLFYTNVQYTAR